MIVWARRILPLLILASIAACAQTKVTRQTPMVDLGLARPDRIWVYDFAASQADLPSDAAIGGDIGAPPEPETPDQIATERKLGADIAKQLVADIQRMGLNAVRAEPGTVPTVGDGIIRGYIISESQGSAAKRFIVGFGSGKSEMSTVVEGFVVTPKGWRRLGSGTLSSASGKTPGAVVPAAVAVASGSPVGLIVVGGLKLYGEASGRSGLEGRAKATADEIAVHLRQRFQDRGWIE
jgi:Domain of unknown function (DUF4410)